MSVAGDTGAQRPARSVSALTARIAGEGADAWTLHSTAKAAKRSGEDVIVLSVGDPDLDTPSAITDAAIAALRAGDTHYTECAGYPSLRAAIAERHRTRTGGDVDPNCVVVTAGAQNALFIAAQCLCGPGDEVLVPSPIYVTYPATIGATGATLISVDASMEEGFRPNPQRLQAAITPATRALFLANPSNPTGVCLDVDELGAIAEIACAHDLWVVSDEVYADLVYEGTHVSMASLPGMAPRTVTVGSLSKSHAMTGWRCGWAIAPPSLVPHMSNLLLCMLYGLPGFVQAGALEALTGSADEAQRMRDRYLARRDRALRRLADARAIRVLVPQAGMFCLLDVRDTGLSGGEFAQRLYAATGVSVLDAKAFGASAEGLLRVSFCVSEAELDEGCDRIVRFVAGLNGPASD